MFWIIFGVLLSFRPQNSLSFYKTTLKSFEFRATNIKNYVPVLWMGFNCLKATGPLQGDTLLFATRFPGVPGTHLIDL